MPISSPSRYRTTNWSAYNGSLRKRGSLSIWFDPDMASYAKKSGQQGRPKTFCDAAIQTRLTLKVLLGLPLRQTVGLVESLIRMFGLDWPLAFVGRSVDRVPFHGVAHRGLGGQRWVKLVSRAARQAS